MVSFSKVIFCPSCRNLFTIYGEYHCASFYSKKITPRRTKLDLRPGSTPPHLLLAKKSVNGDLMGPWKGLRHGERGENVFAERNAGFFGEISPALMAESRPVFTHTMIFFLSSVPWK